MRIMYKRWTYYSTVKRLNCGYNMLLDVTPICDAIVDVVDSEMYLGNKLYNNIYIYI